MRSDRRKILPYGLSGGLPGTPSWNVINPGPNQTILPVCPMRSTPMIKGDEFLHIQAGAGGFGDPLERLPEKVLVDVMNELITPAYAADVYGVVITDEAVDIAATAARRVVLGATQSFREAYLEHFQRSVGINPALAVGV